MKLILITVSTLFIGLQTFAFDDLERPVIRTETEGNVIYSFDANEDPCMAAPEERPEWCKYV